MLTRPFWGYTSPWQEMNRLQREINRLFSDLSQGMLSTAPAYPAVNVWTNQEGVVVTAELPGINPDDLNISVLGNILTLSGKREPEAIQEGGKVHRRERGYGQFTRSIQLPFDVDANKVEATYQNGVLTVSLPRLEEEKPKKIAVKAA